jgi:hypothetical protein
VDYNTKLAGITFHALEYEDPREWLRTKESLMRFLNSLEGRRFVAKSGVLIVVLGSYPTGLSPGYLHVTDDVLYVLGQLGFECPIRTTGFFEELPEDQHLYYSAVT